DSIGFEQYASITDGRLGLRLVSESPSYYSLTKFQAEDTFDLHTLLNSSLEKFIERNMVDSKGFIWGELSLTTSPPGATYPADVDGVGGALRGNGSLEAYQELTLDGDLSFYQQVNVSGNGEVFSWAVKELEEGLTRIWAYTYVNYGRLTSFQASHISADITAWQKVSGDNCWVFSENTAQLRVLGEKRYLTGTLSISLTGNLELEAVSRYADMFSVARNISLSGDQILQASLAINELKHISVTYDLGVEDLYAHIHPDYYLYDPMVIAEIPVFYNGTHYGGNSVIPQELERAMNVDIQHSLSLTVEAALPPLRIYSMLHGSGHLQIMDALLIQDNSVHFFSEIYGDDVVNYWARSTIGKDQGSLVAASLTGDVLSRIEAEARVGLVPILEYMYSYLFYDGDPVDLGTVSDWISDSAVVPPGYDKPLAQLWVDFYRVKSSLSNVTIAKQEVWASGYDINLTITSWLHDWVSGIEEVIEEGSVHAHMYSHSYICEHLFDTSNLYREAFSYAPTIVSGHEIGMSAYVNDDDRSEYFNASNTEIRLPLSTFFGEESAFTTSLEIVAVGTDRYITYPFYVGPESDPNLAGHFRIDQVPWGVGMVYGYEPVVGPIEEVGDIPSTPLTFTSGGSFVDVTVIDTGIDRAHLDLLMRVEEFATITSEGSVYSPGEAHDDDGHGTHVSGTIAADAGFDSQGIYGVAPEVNLHVYKVFPYATSRDIAIAIRRAVDLGTEVISMSLGIDYDLLFNWASEWPYGPELHLSIIYAYHNEVLLIAAAGNEREYELDPSYGGLYGVPSIIYPASDERVISVGAISPNEEPAYFTSSGVSVSELSWRWRVELSAPGMGQQPQDIWYRLPTTSDRDYIEARYPTWIYSTYPLSLSPLGYAWMVGTSMATPHVSGLTAKLWQGNASATRLFLQSLAQDVWEPGYDVATGLGLPAVPDWWRDVPWWWRVLGP
ncbi:MAG: hypothetical protein DRN06_07380, partial [Thermoprotei archaeon]